MSDLDTDNVLKRRRVRSAVRFLAVGRLAFGTMFMVAPTFCTRRVLEGYRSTDEAETFGRLTAARAIALGVGTLFSSWSSDDSEFAWLIAGIIADTSDVYTLLKDESFRFLPRVVSGLTAVGAAGLGIWAFMNVGALRKPTAVSGQDA